MVVGKSRDQGVRIACKERLGLRRAQREEGPLKPMQSRYFKSNLSNFRPVWPNGKRQVAGRSPLQQGSAKTRLAKLPLTSSDAESQPSVIDFLEVNAELPYTTVVEGLEEFLYQSELQPRA